MFLAGLDLGQAGDPSALAVLERQESQGGACYQLRALTRFPLGTSYPDIVDEVHRLWEAYGLLGGDNLLTVDYTGVGRPVVDLFLRLAVIPVRPVTITSGQQASEPRPGWHNVPKRDLAAVVQILLRRRRLQIAAGLEEAGILLKELTNFKVKISTDGRDSYEAWREGDHDDLVLATAMPCWLGERGHLGAFDVTAAIHAPGHDGVQSVPPDVWGAAGEGCVPDVDGTTTLWEAPPGRLTDGLV